VAFNNPEAAAWYRATLRPLLRMGADVFKTDFGEGVPADAVAFNGMTGDELHNLYTLLYNDLVAGLLPVLATPLGPLADGLTLTDIPARDRLAELDFELPLGNQAGGATVQTIADTLDTWLGDGDLLRDYGERLR